MFGVSSSLFLLNATIRHHLAKYCLSHPELVQNLSQSTFVDDIVYGADDEDSAHKLYVESKDIL